MFLTQDEKRLEAAAAKAKQRIDEDRKTKASARVKPLLEHIEAHLFDSGLDSTTLMSACGVRDKSMPTVFKRELGAAPAAYIRDRRMETAARLLRETDLAIWRIGDLVFDVDISSFSAKFKRWSKSAPKKYRQAALAASAEAESLGQNLHEIAEVILRGEATELDLDQLDHLIRYLQTLREAKSPAATPALAIDGPSLERGIALTFWEKLRYLTPKEQKKAVRQPNSLRTTAFFDVLREKSREEGRKDRQVGVRVAELALASLDGVAVHLSPEELANRKAQGWAWLGNARRLALNHPAASRAFAQAKKLLPRDPDPQVLAEICALEGELFLFESKLGKALGLKDRAVDLFRSLGNEESLAASLVSRATTIGRARGYEAAIPDLLDALKLLDSKSQPYLTLAAHHNLLLVYALCGQHAEATKRLPEARSLCERVGDRVALHQLQWTEAIIREAQGDYEAAERQALNAQQGFVSLGEVGYAAALDLDLAEISLELGQPSKALTYALRAIPVFESFKIHREAMAALALLGQVAVDQEIRLEVVRELRGYLRHLLQNPIGFKA